MWSELPTSDESPMITAHARDESAADLDDVYGKLLDQMRVFVGGVVQGHANALGAHELEDGDRRVRIVREGPRVRLHDQQVRTSRDSQGQLHEAAKVLVVEVVDRQVHRDGQGEAVPPPHVRLKQSLAEDPERKPPNEPGRLSLGDELKG